MPWVCWTHGHLAVPTLSMLRPAVLLHPVPLVVPGAGLLGLHVLLVLKVGLIVAIQILVLLI